jgi:G:T-mismatch repair DNA endonuclease (very short patch repair protein)
MTKKCIICNKEFETRSKNYCEKTCSKECRIKHKSNKRKETNKKHLSEFNCKFCDKKVIRYRIRNGFCNKSCASKFYINNGTFDKWRYKIQEKQGIIKKCIICGKDFYAQPHDIEIKKLCGDVDCKKTYMSEFMLKNNPAKGKKEKSETREKIKKTLLEKYGVCNAYELAKHTSLSKPQKEITELLSKNTNKTIMSDFPMIAEGKCYKVDIFIKELNTIIEFNGTYWHCDPRFYHENFLNKKKQKTAKEIWSLDQERLKSLKNLGYNVKVIWEYDYSQNKENILRELLDECKKENFSSR